MNDEKMTGKKVSENIYLCPDGVYRWFYEMDMLKNPTILFTVWKMLGFSIGVVAVIALIIDLIRGTIRRVSDLKPALNAFGFLAVVFFILGIIVYMFIAYLYGWKYIVLFEMNEHEVSHIQMEKQFKKAEALDWLTAMAGIVEGDTAVSGSGIFPASKNNTTSVFRNVESIQVDRRRHTVCVDQPQNRNRIYAEDADLDFAAGFIKERCPKAKIS